MGPAARPAFAKLLRNLGTGELRIGGSSQDLMPFDPVAADTNRVVTPTDLDAIRATLDAVNAGDPGDAVPSWGTILGTTLAPPDPERPWAGPEHARAFTTQGVVPAFAGGAERYVAGIGLGNEPDISYDYDLPRYLADLIAYRDGSVTRPYPLVAPSTSEPVARWQRIQERKPGDALLLGLAGDPRHDRAGDEGRPRRVRRAGDRPLLSARARLRQRRVPLRLDRAAAVRRALGEPRLRGLHAQPRDRGARAGLPPAGGQHGRRPRRRRGQQRRRERAVGADDDVRGGVPAAARRAGRQRELRGRRDRGQPPQRRGARSSSSPSRATRSTTPCATTRRPPPVRRRSARRTTRCCCSRSSPTARPACGRSRSPRRRAPPSRCARGRCRAVRRSAGCSSSTARRARRSSRWRRPARRTRSTA